METKVTAALSFIPIKPMPTYISGDIASISIAVKDIQLGGSSARFVVTLFDKSNKQLGTKAVKMDGDDYAAWGSDDNVAIDFVLKQLGFERADASGPTPDPSQGEGK